jgi:HEPN domain-containing protein
MRQAEKDLIVAQKMHKNGIHEWSCFIAQPAAERAIKSEYQKNGGTA